MVEVAAHRALVERVARLLAARGGGAGGPRQTAAGRAQSVASVAAVVEEVPIIQWALAAAPADPEARAGSVAAVAARAAARRMARSATAVSVVAMAPMMATPVTPLAAAAAVRAWAARFSTMPALLRFQMQSSRGTQRLAARLGLSELLVPAAVLARPSLIGTAPFPSPTLIYS